MGKSYSVNELTEVGRKKFGLSDNWYCFSAVALDGKITYKLSPKDKKGYWLNEEVTGSVIVS